MEQIPIDVAHGVRDELQRATYGYTVDRDQKALAWAIRVLVQHVPPQKQQQPEPPQDAQETRTQALTRTASGVQGTAELEPPAQARLGRA
jgi:hypothetical protein